MTATGINVATLQSATGSLVSVSVNQVSTSANGTLSDSFKQKLANASAEMNNRTQEPAAATAGTQKTEYSKEQVKSNAADEPKAKDNAKVDESTGTEAKASVDDKGQVQTDPKTGNADQAKVTDQNGETENVVSTGKITESVDEDELLGALEVLSTLIAQIAEILQSSMEELQTKMTELQMIPAELTENSGVARLVLNMNGKNDLSDLLVDQGMLDSLNEIKDMIAEVLTEAGMTTEEFQTVTEDDSFKELLETNGIVRKEDIMPRFEAEESTGIDETQEIGKDGGFEVKISKSGFEEKESSNSSSGSFANDSEEENASAGITANRSEKQVRTVKTVETTATAKDFVTGLENVMKTETIEVPGIEGRIEVREVVYQLVEAVKVQISPDNTSLEMSLNPENLGKVNLNITSKNGVMTAQITTQNEISKEALESQLQTLKETIEAQGVRVDAIEVTVAAYTFADSKNAESDAQGQKQENGKNRNKGISSVGNDLPSVDEAERIRQEVLEQTGSTVTYVA